LVGFLTKFCSPCSSGLGQLLNEFHSFKRLCFAKDAPTQVRVPAAFLEHLLSTVGYRA
jgi:hypothetical protein